MTCSCHSGSTTYPAGSSTATANTYIVPAGSQQQLVGSQPQRRSVLVVNQSGGPIVVGFGQVSTLTAGAGSGYDLAAGDTLSVNTTAEVTVMNPQASPATVGLIVELD